MSAIKIIVIMIHANNEEGRGREEGEGGVYGAKLTRNLSTATLGREKRRRPEKSTSGQTAPFTAGAY